jgi:hypothetical protein
MGQGEIIQIKSETDGCVYICNLLTGKWQKVCDIVSIGEMPEDVRAKFDMARRGLEALHGESGKAK